MKKALIAGAASTVLAAMPVVGVFAADLRTHTDEINISISPVCTLSTVDAGAATATDATTHNPTEANSSFAGVWSSDTLNATMAAGTEKTLGTTTFTVRCNNQKGYTLSANTGTAAGTLVSTTNSTDVINTTNGSTYAAGTSGTSYWRFQVASEATGITVAQAYANANAIPTTSTTIATAAANSGNLQDGQQITVTYSAGIDNFQATGTYNGSVVYTLATVD